MTTDIKRVIVTTLMVKIILGIIIFIMAQTNANTNAIESQITQSNEQLNFIQNTFPNKNTETETTVLEKNFGDIKGLQESLPFNLLKAGIGFVSLNDVGGNETDAEKIIRMGFNGFLQIINILIALEILFLIWSKKWS